MARPTKDALEKLVVAEVSHARFHLGVQFLGTKLGGSVTQHLDRDNHSRHGLEMKYLANGHLHVTIEDQEWIVPDSVIHSVKLDKEA